MKALPIDHLAPFDSNQPLDYCFVYSSNSDVSHYLVYERQRDFLSVPRSFVVVSFISLDIDWVDLNVNSAYDCFTYDEDGICEEKGFFLIEQSDLTAQRDQLHFFMSMKDLALEVVCHSFEAVTTIYFSKNAQAALAEFLHSLPD